MHIFSMAFFSSFGYFFLGSPHCLPLSSKRYLGYIFLKPGTTKEIILGLTLWNILFCTAKDFHKVII